MPYGNFGKNLINSVEKRKFQFKFALGTSQLHPSHLPHLAFNYFSYPGLHGIHLSSKPGFHHFKGNTKGYVLHV